MASDIVGEAAADAAPDSSVGALAGDVPPLLLLAPPDPVLPLHADKAKNAATQAARVSMPKRIGCRSLDALGEVCG
ncbi:hypothetical protein [Paraburkholderia sp. GAS199]|uniref:hypothetical protein n=1 Tax=Paraburkholderia sp. GAS199 TaxID=3035126 RepID=UPI003D24D41A